MKYFFVRHKLVLGFVLAIFAVCIFTPGHAAANGQCIREGSVVKEYNYGGYHYRIIKLGINGVIQAPSIVPNAWYVANSAYMASGVNHDDPTKANYYVISDSQAYISSTTCNGGPNISGPNDYGGAMISGQPDEIDASYGVFAWINGSFGNVRPNAINLGLPPKPGGDPNPDGVLTTADGGNGYVCVPNQPTLGGTNAFGLSVSLFRCNNNNASDISNGYSRASASLDDAGRLVVQSNGGPRTIWCTELNTSTYYPHSTPSGYVNCNPDIEGVNPPRGSGFLFRDDQTCPGNISNSSYNCNDPVWTAWYKRAGLYGQDNLTPLINADAAGYLQRLYVHYDARNTGTGGFGAANFFRLRYPTNGGICSSFTINGDNSSTVSVGPSANLNLHADYQNTGTRPWRDSDGYNFLRNSGPAPASNPAFPSGIIKTGQHATFNTTVTSPAAAGTSTISWSLQQNGGVVATCSRNITVVSGNFVLYPTTLKPVLNGAPDSPSAVQFESYIDAQFTSGATVVSGVRVEPRYYVKHSDNTISGIAALGDNVTYTAPNITTTRYSIKPASFATSGLGLVIGDQLCSLLEVVHPGSGTVTAQGLISVFGPDKNTPEVCVRLTNIPYISAFGGSVVAGGNFVDSSNSCDQNPGQQITTWYDTTNKKGSGSQFRAQATDQITGFPSAFLKTGAASFGTGLSFTNDSLSATINPILAQYGGSFDKTDCIPSWYVDPPAGTAVNATNNVASGTGFLGSLSPGTYTYYYSTNIGSLKIGTDIAVAPYVNTDSIANGVHIIVYVDGDVSIVDNIIYQNAISGWGSLANIPSVDIIAKGNIYIHSAVTQLDGVYVAQQKNVTLPDETSNGGWVYTCASPAGTPYGPYDGHYEVYNSLPPTNGGGRCSGHQLVINGAVIGQKFKLLRTGSSLRYALPGASGAENLSSAARDCAFNPSSDAYPDPNHPVCAAEVFDLSPEVYLVNPFPPSAGQLNAINDLPPIL